MDDAPLPELHEGQFDAETFAAYLDDLETCAEVLDVLVKGAPTERTDGTVWALREAAQALRAGSVGAMQVRYRFEDAEWRDTLLWRPDGLQCVRMKMEW